MSYLDNLIRDNIGKFSIGWIRIHVTYLYMQKKCLKPKNISIKILRRNFVQIFRAAFTLKRILFQRFIKSVLGLKKMAQILCDNKTPFCSITILIFRAFRICFFGHFENLISREKAHGVKHEY